ncbi:MAG TPA: NAD(P)/FAD-dependent oxidoreductase [Acidimicrobiia bacterium]|nr:NAD(P)/FAD-dependent oxidoreductase [Acidimicrobiia bacterium]
MDAVVIGAGHNGLVAANLLAERGWRVVVLEAEPTPGGAVRSAELIEPGFVNDRCSAFYPMAVASPVMRSLRLEEHGVRWRHAPLVLAHPTLDACPTLSRDLACTVASLEATHPGDGEAWARLYGLWERLREPLLGALFRPFPPVRALPRLLARPPRELVELARFALLPVRRLGQETFGGEPARHLLAAAALHADLAPESAISGFFGFLLCSLGQELGWPVPEGGAQRLTDALVARLRAHGGDVVCNTRVERVVVRDGRAVAVRTADDEVAARRAVVADVAAPHLYQRLVGEAHLPAWLVRQLENFQWDSATFKVDWNLDGPIPWMQPEARRAGTVHIVDSVDALTVVASQLVRGLVPERPFLLLGQQSLADPTRHPPGKETAWAYTHVPQDVRGDAGGTITGRWDRDEVETFADRVENEIERLAPGFRSLVRGRHVTAPPSFADEDANLVGGAIGGGTMQLHQQLVFRPVPGFGRAETPVRGLYLGSASAHPGGSVNGAPGANAARAAIWGARRQAVRGLVTRGV